MTKKDYILIADILHRARDTVARDPWAAMVTAFMTQLKNNNPSFNSVTFAKACGFENTQWNAELMRADIVNYHHANVNDGETEGE